jgi:hypothetical protein
LLNGKTKSPTAQQLLAEVQVTACSSALVPELGAAGRATAEAWDAGRPG